MPLQLLMYAARPMPEESKRQSPSSGADSLNRHRPSFAHSSGNSPVKSVCLFSIVFSAMTVHLHRLLAWISSPVNVAFAAVTETVLLPTARVGKFSSSRYGRAFRRMSPSTSST